MRRWHVGACWPLRTHSCVCGPVPVLLCPCSASALECVCVCLCVLEGAPLCVRLHLCMPGQLVPLTRLFDIPKLVREVTEFNESLRSSAGSKKIR